MPSLPFVSLRSMIFVVMATLYTTDAKIVDLSHKHTKDLAMIHPHTEYKTTPVLDGEIKPGVYTKSSSYSVGEHGGTHVDAPNHFHKDGRSLADIEIEQTIADGVMIDCSTEVGKDPNYALTVEKLKAWEESNGRIPKGAAVVVNFNWSRKISDAKQYYSTQTLDNPGSYRYPVVSKAAGDWLVDERDINILAIDSPTPDLLNGVFPVHVKLLKLNKLIVESLNDPGKLPAKGFRFHATPVKFVGGTGVQVRAFAVIDEGNGGSQQSVGCFVVVVAMAIFSRWMPQTY